MESAAGHLTLRCARSLVWLFSVALFGAPSGPAPVQPVVRVGRISSSSGSLAPERLDRLVKYLGSKIPGYSFESRLFPDSASLLAAVAAQEVDFVQATPSVFVELEVKYGATAVVSAVTSPRPGSQFQRIGGAVFCLAEQNDIRQLKDLRGKRVAALYPHSLGGALAVWRELRSVGVREDKDLKEIRYVGTVENAIGAVLRGEVDCGISASDSLEDYLYRDYVERRRIRVLPPPRPSPQDREYPFGVSTRLYPSSALAKMRQTPLALANKAAIALLDLEPGGELARSMGTGGWSVSLNYEPVHECLRDLGVTPYQSFGKVTLAEAIRQHWTKVFTALAIVIIVLAAMALRALLLNRKLRASRSALELELAQRKRAEQERAVLEDQLQQSQKLESIGRLAGGVAHDFNNLLTVINGYGELLAQYFTAGDPLGAYAREITRAGGRAANLTQQLLAFSRKQIIEPKPLDLNALVAESATMLRRLIGEEIDFVTVLDPLLGHVMADDSQMSQILMNLAVNARDAMKGSGKLIIDTANVDLDQAATVQHPEAAPGPYVRLSVSDNGAGMDEETLSHIFEPFFTTKERGSGTGLGLSMVYGIVRQNNGWISIDCEQGKGTTFKIYLPRIEAAKVSGGAQPARTAPCGSETILVAEDQEEVRRFASDVLRFYGYQVLEASNGEQALNIANNHRGPIHLLVTDVVMPGMNGRELAKMLVPLRPQMLVLYTSGYSEEVIAHRGVLDQEIAYLPKPFTPAALAARVREVLSSVPGSK